MSDDPRNGDPRAKEPRTAAGDLGPFAEECPEERIEKLKEQAAELTRGEMVFWESGDLPPEVLERFWSHVVAFEGLGEPSFQPLEVLRSAPEFIPGSREGRNRRDLGDCLDARCRRSAGGVG